MIKISNLNKRFSDDGPNILQDVNFQVSEGEFVVLIGPSGCGKSTLLNLLAGYDELSSGELLMHGETIQGPSHKRAVISQVNTLYPWYNVEQNIAYGLKMRKQATDLITTRTEAILKDVQLEQYRKHKVFEISGGMKQRVSLARTLINDSELILMDEPLGALDSLTRTSMQKLIHDLWKDKGLTILMITHDIEEALLLADRVIVMSKVPGRIIAEFKPNFNHVATFDEVITSPEFMEMKLEIMKRL